MRANLYNLSGRTQEQDALLETLNSYDHADLRIGGEIILLQGDPLLMQSEPGGV